MKIQNLFHETDPTRICYDLQSTKPEDFKTKSLATCLHVQPQALEIMASAFTSVQIGQPIQKTKTSTHLVGPNLQNLKFQAQMISHVLPRATRSSGVLCLWEHAPTCAAVKSHVPAAPSHALHAPTKEDDVI